MIEKQQGEGSNIQRERGREGEWDKLREGRRREAREKAGKRGVIEEKKKRGR